MDLNDSPEQAAYRAQVRSWLDEHKAQAPVLRGEGALTDPDEILAARRAWQGRLAEGGWRASRGRRSTADRDAARSSRSSSARRCARRRCRASSTSSASACSARRSSPMAARSRSRATWDRCCTATRSGARCSRSPPPGRTWPQCRHAPGWRTTAPGRSTGRRSGRRTPSSPRSGCCWRARTPT